MAKTTREVVGGGRQSPGLWAVVRWVVGSRRGKRSRDCQRFKESARSGERALILERLQKMMQRLTKNSYTESPFHTIECFQLHNSPLGKQAMGNYPILM